MALHGATLDPALYFDVWGCRGSRCLEPGQSSIGIHTACYSILWGEDLLVLDAGRGLAALGGAIARQARFRDVRRIHVLLSHAHMDHWEGLKDVDWFWRRDRALEITIHGTMEALGTVERAFSPPAYVPLRQLVLGGPVKVESSALSAGTKRELGVFEVTAESLHHYSGSGQTRCALDAVGYRIDAPGGPGVAYVSDHEPPKEGTGQEEALLRGAALALGDAHFPDRAQQMHGHGSQEFWAEAARRRPETLVLAGHLGPLLRDAEVKTSARRHGEGLPNFRLAREGETYRWSVRERRFVPPVAKPRRRT
jgi:phosphoribosyl 1,2-cyclic phosphodiesterase